MKPCFGYKHWTLEDQPRCFYVGKGLESRPFQKNIKERNHKWHAIVKRLGFRVEVCVGPMEHYDACAWEIENIALENTFSTNHSHDDPIDIGCNFTMGGEGGFGRIWTLEQRQSASVKKLGVKPNETTREKMRVSAKGRPPVRAETRVKHSDAMRGTNNVHAKLTIEMVIELKLKYLSGFSQRALVDVFHVKQSTISRALNGATHASVRLSDYDENRLEEMLSRYKK